MSKTLVPGANTTAQYWAGKFVGSTMNTNCACIHTTEGASFPAYSGGATAPHLTVLPNIAAKTVTMRQHFPANKSSRALANLAGGVETNTLNVFQIELIGTCDSRYASHWPNVGTAGVDYIYWPDAPDWLLAAIAPIFRWLDAEWPNFNLVDATPRGWVQYPTSYGINAKQRFTFAEWRDAYGIFGHQHVPENAHGDPGNFPIKRLIELATGATPVPTPTPEPTPATKTLTDYAPSDFGPGKHGPQVTLLGQRLVAHGFDKHFTSGRYFPGPTWGEIDRLNTQDFQLAQGWKGTEKGGDADGFVGPESLRRLDAEPATAPPKPAPEPEPAPAPADPTLILLRTVSLNCAAYDTVGHGKKTIGTRVPKIAATVLSYDPTTVAYQELNGGSLAAMDKAMHGYTRVPGGRDGREIYARDDLQIIASGLGQISTELDGDNKPYAWLVYRKSGALALDISFHNENQKKNAVQRAQLREVLIDAYKIAGWHDVPHENIGVFGDSNLPTANDDAEKLGWKGAGKRAPSRLNWLYKTANQWRAAVKGQHIDVALVPASGRFVTWKQLLNHTLSDHNLNVTERQITR